MEDEVSKYISQLREIVEGDALWALRGKAIAAYAGIERILCFFLSLFGDMEIEVARVIYYRINNSMASAEILKKLKKRKIGDDYSEFWNSLGKKVANLSTIRNKIVHWSAEMRWDHKGVYSGIELSPSGVLDNESKPETNITAKQLTEFITECEFVTKVSIMFYAILLPSISENFGKTEKGKAWLEIFQQPLVYPPKNPHPLLQNWTEPESPPPPSGESQQPPPS